MIFNNGFVYVWIMSVGLASVICILRGCLRLAQWIIESSEERNRQKKLKRFTAYGTFYVVRMKDGRLFVTDSPRLEKSGGFWIGGTSGMMQLPSRWFPDVKWEDERPTETGMEFELDPLPF